MALDLETATRERARKLNVALELAPERVLARAGGRAHTGIWAGACSSSSVGSDCRSTARHGAKAISSSGSGLTAGTGADSGKTGHNIPDPRQTGRDVQTPPATSVKETLEADRNPPSTSPAARSAGWRRQTALRVGGQAAESKPWPFLPHCLLWHLCRGLGTYTWPCASRDQPHPIPTLAVLAEAGLVIIGCSRYMSAQPPPFFLEAWHIPLSLSPAINPTRAGRGCACSVRYTALAHSRCSINV